MDTTPTGFEGGEAAYVRDDYSNALREFLPLAKTGHLGAQFYLGHMYAHGQGVLQDYGEALKWYRMAAEEGLPDAQVNLGYMYDAGKGVPQDYREAAKWYGLSVIRDAACQSYGTLLLKRLCGSFWSSCPVKRASMLPGSSTT